MKEKRQQNKLGFIAMDGTGGTPFRVTWQGLWMPECSLSKSRLRSKLNLREVKVSEFPLPEFPGFQRSAEPPFKDRESLAEFLHESIASLFYNPASVPKKSIAEEITDLILGLQHGLEGMARTNDEHSALGLLEIAERATSELDRELNRGNPTLKEQLETVLTWPSHQSVNGGVQQVIFENLEMQGFGKKVKSFKGKTLTSYAQEIVNFLSPYISNTLPVVDSLIKQRVFERVKPEEISSVFHILKDLPRQLTTDTVEAWFCAGEEILKLMAGNENYLTHPYFKTALFEGKSLTNWKRDMEKAWKTRAS